MFGSVAHRIESLFHSELSSSQYIYIFIYVYNYSILRRSLYIPLSILYHCIIFSFILLFITYFIFFVRKQVFWMTRGPNRPFLIFSFVIIRFICSFVHLSCLFYINKSLVNVNRTKSNSKDEVFWYT